MHTQTNPPDFSLQAQWAHSEICNNFIVRLFPGYGALTFCVFVQLCCCKAKRGMQLLPYNLVFLILITV